MPGDAAGSQQIELYYAFSLEQEEQSLSLIRSTVIISGIALTLFVVGIGVLVTRLVVDPVRRAAGTAQRLAEGQLEERMTVRGEDDLARLATASTRWPTACSGRSPSWRRCRGCSSGSPPTSLTSCARR